MDSSAEETTKAIAQMFSHRAPSKPLFVAIEYLRRGAQSAAEKEEGADDCASSFI